MSSCRHRQRHWNRHLHRVVAWQRQRQRRDHTPLNVAAGVLLMMLMLKMLMLVLCSAPVVPRSRWRRMHHARIVLLLLGIRVAHGPAAREATAAREGRKRRGKLIVRGSLRRGRARSGGLGGGTSGSSRDSLATRGGRLKRWNLG